MLVRLSHSFSFEAAHYLSWHGGRCRNLHGHHYRFEVTLTGPVDERGIVIDFDDLSAVVSEVVLAEFDHRLLNEILENPTAELIASEIWRRLEGRLAGLERIRLYETPECFVEVRAG